MSEITINSGRFINTASKLGITVPKSIVKVMGEHPRDQMNAHFDGAPNLQAAIHTALNNGVNPATDPDVQTALIIKQVWTSSGDIDALHDRRISAAFADAWPEIVKAVAKVFDPAAETFAQSHQILSGKGLDHKDAEAIRRAGGSALTAWAQALGAEEIITAIPMLMTSARLTINPSASGSRVYWVVLPNLDTWNGKDQPNVKDPWAVLESGATLALAETGQEAEQRAQLVGQEQALANAARAAAARRGGFDEDARPIEYEGADGVTRVITGERVARSISTVKNAFGHEQEV